ncbi:MAG: hypothetical protein ACYTCU_05130 [Planctomycetota bacterium]
MILRRLLPAILLALGILAGTAVAAALSHAGWWVMAGPLVLGACIAVAGALEQRQGVAVAVGAIFVLAAAIVALRDPARVPDAVPLLGAGGLVVLLRPRHCARSRADATAGGSAR